MHLKLAEENDIEQEIMHEPVDPNIAGTAEEFEAGTFLNIIQSVNEPLLKRFV